MKNKPAYEELEAQVRELKLVKEKLQKSEKMYRALFEHAAFSIVILRVPGGEVVAFNNKAYEMLGYKREEYENLAIDDIDVNGKPSDEYLAILEKYGSYTFETRHIKKNGDIINMLLSSVRTAIDGDIYHQNIGIDITAFKDNEKALTEARAELELRVEERTKELQEKTYDLEEMNAALHVLLKKRNEDKINIEKNVLKNVQELVDPYLDKFKRLSLTERQNEYLNIIESNLIEITSPLAKNLSDNYLKFTPAEIKISNLIKQGKTSKEIANINNISLKTVESHRENIRKKLGINGKKASLRTYLLSIK